MITPADDYPLHQTSRPFRDPSTDRNLYDRFFFNGYPTTGEDAGELFFAVAFGQYVGRNVMDGAFSIVADGVQRQVRGSRLLGHDRLDLGAGPVRIEILEPLRSVRVLVDEPAAGIAADLTFTARGPAFEEPRYQWTPGHLTTMDITRLTQNGSWAGWIDVAGRRLTVDPDVWLGTRDRSWGIRGSGQRETNTAPDGPPPQFYWLWAPLNFPDMNVILDVNETTTGHRWHGNAMTAPVTSAADSFGTPTQEGTHTYEIDWRPGTRHANGFRMNLDLPGGPVGITLKRRLTFFMQGIGYGHPTWSHGMYLGPDERTHDQIDAGENYGPELGLQHVQLLSEATRDDGVKGMGILEMMIVGPHAPSGLTDYTGVK